MLICHGTLETCQKVLRGAGFDPVGIGLQVCCSSNWANLVVGGGTSSFFPACNVIRAKVSFALRYSRIQDSEVEEIIYHSKMRSLHIGVGVVPKYYTAQSAGQTRGRLQD